MNNEWHALQASIQSSCISREASGWFSIMCPVCGGGKDKRVTGGFLCTDEAIVYTCFRGKCDAATGFELGQYIPNKFKALMERMGVPIGMKLRTAKRLVKEREEDLDETLYKKHSYPSIEVPEFWIPIHEVDATHITNRFEDRCCNMEDLHYIDSGKYQGLAGIVHKWWNRPIGLTVFGDYPFQIDGADNMLYTVGGKFGEDGDTILLVEGEIDAMSMPNAVSVGGYKVSPQQAYMLRGKSIICIPEKSNKFIEQFESYGWKMCIPQWDAGDLNEAVVRYGVLNTAQMIKDGTPESPLRAKMEYQMWVNKLK